MSSKLWGELLELGFHKRAAYRFENEWRAALYQDSRPEVVGITVTCDLAVLIEEVVVNPWAEAFFLESVGALMERFQLDRPLNRSQLLEPPKPSS